MGLRSFAREYKETVASGGLRGLIGTLSKDSEDVDTIKVVLETLLLLFVKDESNVCAYHYHTSCGVLANVWGEGSRNRVRILRCG